jgi:hypothetical protein
MIVDPVVPIIWRVLAQGAKQAARLRNYNFLIFNEINRIKRALFHGGCLK